MHASPHASSPAGHFCWHAPFTQSTAPPVGVAHFVHDVPHAATVSPLHVGVPEVPEVPDEPEVPESSEVPDVPPEVPGEVAFGFTL